MSTVTRDSEPKFSWVTDLGVSLDIVTRAEEGGVDLRHDRSVHAAHAGNPGWFCAPTSIVRGVSVANGVLELRHGAAQYCRKSAVGGATVGWNVILTVGDGSTAIASLRHESLSFGGRWHVSANEGADPEDFDVSLEGVLGDARVPLPIGRIVGRCLVEELGLVCAPEALEDVTRAVGLFKVGANLGVLFHVRGEQLGWDADTVFRAHKSALDAWEGVPTALDLSAEGLRSLADPSGWTPWALPCFEELVLQGVLA